MSSKMSNAILRSLFHTCSTCEPAKLLERLQVKNKLYCIGQLPVVHTLEDIRRKKGERKRERERQREGEGEKEGEKINQPNVIFKHRSDYLKSL